MSIKRCVNRSGRIYGNLKVISLAYVKQRLGAFWNCICSCGNEAIVRGNSLQTGHTKSCGCLGLSTRFKVTHGESLSITYRRWASMVSRCRTKGAPRYRDYGGRGIKVCKRWLNYENFKKDMGEVPAGLTLDRIDNNGNYCKSNCMWSTVTEQNRNKRNSSFIKFNGETKCVAEWAHILDVRVSTLHRRIKRGEDFADLYKEYCL